MKDYHHIPSLEKLEELLDISYDIPNRDEFNEYIFQHPLRFTSYLLKQIKKSEAIAKQYLPDPRELEIKGVQKPLCGIVPTHIPGLERLYLDRVILMPTSQCFAYCRFCFRKNYSHDTRDGDYGSPQDNFEQALNYIREDDRIKEVLITGGDPLMFPNITLDLCKKLQKIPHLTSIRIGTRIFTSDPKLIDEEWIKPFTELNTISQKLPLPNSQLPTPITISPHINHPDELSPETIRSLLLCTQNNIPLYNQTVLLKKINNDAKLLIDLNRKLRQLGVDPYRIYLADPLQGTEYLRCPLDEFIAIKKYMRSHASGRIVPSFIIDTQVGKGEYGSDLEIIKKEDSTIWFKTPYKAETYRSIKPSWKVPEFAKEGSDGSLIVAYEDAVSIKVEEVNPFKILHENTHIKTSEQSN